MNKIDKEKIKTEAKEIMDNFMNALADIEVEEEFNLTRKNSFREENNGNKPNEQFKQKFLENAPKISGNSIVANKGEWTKK